MTTVKKVRDTRKVHWVKAAWKDFADFPAKAQVRAAEALTVVADGATPDIAILDRLGQDVKVRLTVRTRPGAEFRSAL